MTRLVLLAALVALPGCKTAEDLAPFPCARDNTCPSPLVCLAGVCQKKASCDVVGQDCPNGGRCFAFEDGPLCAPDPGGTVQAGGACRLGAFTGPDGDPVSDCAAGHSCTDLLRPTGATLCRRFCRTHAECGAGGRCAAGFMVATESGDDEEIGVCLEACTAFGGQCRSGESCKYFRDNRSSNSSGFCAVSGSRAAGEPCTRHSDCAAGTTCIFNTSTGNRCSALCDPTHPCAGGQTCSRFDGLAAGDGFCSN